MGAWEIGLSIVLLAILVAGLVVTQAVAQQKERKRLEDRKEIARCRNQIDITQDLLQNIQHIPHTTVLLYCLQKNIERALEEILMVDSGNKIYSGDLLEIQAKINELNLEDTQVFNKLNVPKADKAAIAMLKLVKASKGMVRRGFSRGNINNDLFSTEMRRLEEIEVRINIENISSKIMLSIKSGHMGTAIQLLKKGISLLESKDDAYSESALAKMKDKLESLTSATKRKNDAARDEAIEKEKDELDELFTPKKKW